MCSSNRAVEVAGAANIIPPPKYYRLIAIPRGKADMPNGSRLTDRTPREAGRSESHRNY